MINGCIGEKLTHSFSKEIHSKFFSYPYELVELKRDELEPFFEKRGFNAVNITIPYKQDVIKYLDCVSEMAEKIGAVNTVVNRDGSLYGYNTDFLGMTALIKRSGVDLKGKKVVILGGGGTSKTSFEVACCLGACEVLKVSRREGGGCISYDQMYSQHGNAEIIINTTPCGMYPETETCAADITKFPSLQAVFDAVYNPLRSRLVLEARANGTYAVGGLFMLVSQAAYAAGLFTGESVSDEKIKAVYKSVFLEKQNIVLTGMPGSGKTTVGKRLAKMLGRDFYDTDKIIAEKKGKTIPEIFSEVGENGFRLAESEAVCEVSKKSGCVIATGGGAVLKQENIRALASNGRIYFLDRPLENIIPTKSRPLSDNREDLKKRFDERYEIYKKTCDVQINASTAVKENAEKIREDFQSEDTCD